MIGSARAIFVRLIGIEISSDEFIKCFHRMPRGHIVVPIKQNNKTVAILVSQTNLMGVGRFCGVKFSFVE